MPLKKQTVWLLTMLTLMVVLSAYYLFYGDVAEIDMANQTPNQQENLANTEAPQDVTNTNVDITTVPSTATEDFFTELRLERARSLDQLKETQSQIILNTEDKDKIASANAKIEELETLESNAMVVESLIKAEGYADAVVITSDEKVNVIVQADKLENQQVVSIINLVSKEMKVPGINVIVKNRP